MPRDPDRWLAEHLRAEAPRLALGAGALVVASFVNFRTGAQLKAAIETAPSAGRGAATSSLLLFSVGAVAGCVRTFIFDSTAERLRATLAAEVFAGRLRAEPAEPASARAAADCSGDCGAARPGGGPTPAPVAVAASAAMDDSDVALCAELVLKLQNVARFTSSVVGGTAAMFYTSWKLSAAIWPLLVTGALRGARAGANRSGKAAERLAQARERALGFAEERLQHQDLVRWFSRAEPEAEEFQGLCSACVTLASKAARGRSIAHLVFDFASKGVLLGICNLGTRLVQRGDLTAGELTAFFFHASFLGLGLYGLVGLAPEIAVARNAAKRLAGALAEVEAGDFGRPPAPVTPLSVRFENVYFEYSTGEGVLDSFTLNVPAGSTCALVGTSGSGKSTAIALLLRDVVPQRGRILLGEEDIMEMPRGVLRCKVSVAPQQPALLGSSMHNAIAFGAGKEAGSVAASEVEAAAREACAHEFIAARPGAYASAVGRGGSQLSGGERQRVSLARALVRKAPVLLLDEPTSALDATTAAQLAEAVLAKRPGRPTTLVVTHSLALIRRCEAVAVLSSTGHVVQYGDFATLAAEVDGPLAHIIRAGELVDDAGGRAA